MITHRNIAIDALVTSVAAAAVIGGLYAGGIAWLYSGIEHEIALVRAQVQLVSGQCPDQSLLPYLAASPQVDACSDATD